MRDPVANKAVTMTSTGTCPSCGRPSTPYGCRDVPRGWWCLAAGLKEDPSRWILPSQDPLSEAEQRTADAYAGPIADAERAVDEAMEWHAAAEQAYGRAVWAARKAGVTDLPMLVPFGPSAVYAPASRVTPEQREEAAEVAQEAQVELADAAEALSRARAALTGIGLRRDAATRQARLSKRATKPRRSWLPRLGRTA